MTLRNLIPFTPVVLITLLSAVFPVLAGELEDQEYFLTVDAIYSGDSGLQLGAVQCGSDQGVVRGERLLLYRNSGDGLEEIGHARIDSLSRDFAIVRLIPTEVDSCVVGDLVAMRARVAWPDQGLISLKIATYALTLTDLQWSPIFDPDSLLGYPGSANDDSTCSIFMEALTEVHPYLDGMEVLQDTLPDGRFAGITAAEALRSTDTADIRAYLQYVRSYPGKYVGQTFRLAETYAAWVVSGAMVSGWEVIEAYPRLTESERIEYLTLHREMLLEDTACETWYNESRDLYLGGQHELALLILGILGDAATLYDLESWHHYHWAAKSDIHSWAGEYEEALEAVTHAIATAGDDSINHSSGYHNRATVLQEMERWGEAIADYERSLRWKGALENPHANPLSASSLEGIGVCYLEMQEYILAEEYLLVALEVLEADADLEALESQARAYSRLGDVYDATGRYGKAIEAWRGGWGAAEKLGWKTTMADALDNVSDGHWNLGELRLAVEARLEALTIALELADEERQARIRINLGELHYRLGDNRSSEESFDTAMGIYRRLDMPWDIADTHSRLGGYHEHRGDVTAAIGNYTLADSIFGELGNLQSRAGVRATIAAALVQQGQIAVADEYFAMAHASYTEAGDRAKQAEVMRDWGLALFRERDPERVREKLTTALDLYEELDDLGGQSDCHRFIGNLTANYDGDTRRGLAEGERALELARIMPSKPHIAEALITIGYRWSTLGNMGNALTHLEEALTVFQETEDAQGIARSYLALGDILGVMGEYDRAEANFTTALRIAEEAEIDVTRADAMGSMAWQLYSLGETEEAKRYARQALEIHHSLGNEWSESRHYTTLGSIATSEGELEESLTLHGRAQELDLRWNNILGQTANLNNIGQVHHGLRDFARAAEFYEGSLKISERLQYHDAMTATIGNLANCYYELDRQGDALALVQRGINTARKGAATPRLVQYGRLQGKLLRMESRFAEARQVLEEALVKGESLGNTVTVLGIRAELGILAWAEGDFALASRTLKQMITDARVYPMPMIIAEPLLFLGRAHRDLGSVDRAIYAYREAVEQLEQVGSKLKSETTRASFQAQHGEAYLELVELLYSLERNEEAWEVLGLMKSQEMRDLTPGGHGGAEDPRSKALLEQADSMVSREALLMQKLNLELAKPEAEQRLDLIETWEAQLDTIVYAFEDFVANLKDDHPEIYERLEIEPISFHQLQGSLELDEAFIEPLLLPDKLIIFIVRGGDDPLVVREVQVSAVVMDSLIQEMRFSLSRPAMAWETTRAKLAMRDPAPLPVRPTAASEELYKLLIDPIAPDLHGARTLIFCPSGRLRYIPFAALYDGEGYLIDRYHSSVLTKAGVLAGRGSIRPEASILAFCNPDSSLTGAEREVRKLEEMWSEPKITTYCGDDATKVRLRREVRGYQILHLATHGVLLSSNPEGSYILMGGEGQRMNLTFKEISVLPLRRVELAVLSACDTAVGENGEGKEIAGLAYQFQDRGTASVIATLWAVDDESTADLMVELYTALQPGTTSRVEALHRAQMALRQSEDHAHPYYWAPFILIGSWR